MSRYLPGDGFSKMPWLGFIFLVPVCLITAIPSYGFSLLVLAYAIWDRTQTLRKNLRNPMRRSVDRHTQGLVNHASAINRAVLNKPPAKGRQ